MNPLATAWVRLNALRVNLAAIRRRVAPGTQLCPAVKANAYGHGLEQVLPVLIESGVECVSVANLEEALSLRRLGWARPVLCLAPMLSDPDGPVRRERADAAVAGDVSLTVMSLAEARELAAAAATRHRVARVEIKVDTGMGRMGLAPDEAQRLATEIAALQNVTIEGVYTHLACADEADLRFTREQMGLFVGLRDRLREAGVPVRHFHAANSAALFRLPETHLDRVRPGLSLYGYWGGPEAERPRELRPCLKIVSRLTAVRPLPAGHAVGYGRTFIAPRDSLIGLVPIGYGDGYSRHLGGQGVMTLEPVRGRGRLRAPVVGRVSMDQTTVDLTDAGDVRVGDPVTVIDDDPAAPNGVEALARRLGTIPYEVTCLIGPRIERRGC